MNEPQETTLIHRRVGRCSVAVVHRPVPMARHEWDDFMSSVMHIGETEGEVQICVRTEGKGGPDALMRSELNEAGERFSIHVVVLTSSRIVKGIATAVSWIGTVKIKAFAPDDTEAAFEWLGTPPGEKTDLKATLRTLEYRLRVEQAS